MKKIKFLFTGGTIDKIYSEYKGDLSYSVSHIPEIIEQARIRIDYSCETIMLKDSLDLNAYDRIGIREYCTLIEDECIIPYVVSKSDAVFNIGCAVAYSQSLPHGTYVVMNGIAFDALNVIKNKATQTFEVVHKE